MCPRINFTFQAQANSMSIVEVRKTLSRELNICNRLTRQIKTSLHTKIQTTVRKASFSTFCHENMNLNLPLSVGLFFPQLFAWFPISVTSLRFPVKFNALDPPTVLIQGHPTNLFLTLSVPQRNSCWLAKYSVHIFLITIFALVDLKTESQEQSST